LGWREGGEEEFEFGDGVDDGGEGAGSGPLLEAGELEGCRGEAGGFEFDFEVGGVPEAVDIGVAGGAEGGAVAFAEDEGGVLGAQFFEMGEDGVLEVAFEGFHLMV
jgi:hypothetical protein